jgi:hypothetical protein
MSEIITYPLNIDLSPVKGCILPYLYEAYPQQKEWWTPPEEGRSVRGQLNYDNENQIYARTGFENHYEGAVIDVSGYPDMKDVLTQAARMSKLNAFPVLVRRHHQPYRPQVGEVQSDNFNINAAIDDKPKKIAAILFEQQQISVADYFQAAQAAAQSRVPDPVMLPPHARLYFYPLIELKIVEHPQK